MKVRSWAVIGIGAAAAILIAATVVNQLPGRTTTTADRTPATSSATSRSSATPAAPERTEDPQPPTTTSPPQSQRFTTEVIPGQGGNGALPKTTELPEPISRPLPETANAKGKLANGYPANVLPPAPQSSIATSAVTSQDAHLQVTLTATSTLTVTDLHEYYRTALAKFGMYDTDAPAGGGASAYTFRRGDDTVTLTASPSGKKTSYILYGAFTANS